MINKQWSKNIPKQGVLCRCPAFGNLVEITELTEKDIKTYEKLGAMPVPITSDEWWQFAPWQDVDENTPKNTPVLTIDNYGVIGIEQYLYWGYLKGARKWLPLPEITQED